MECAQQRAATLVIRRRVTKATTGFPTTASICAFVIAGAIFGITTDKVADLRTTTAGTLTTIKQCGEASATKKNPSYDYRRTSTSLHNVNADLAAQSHISCDAGRTRLPGVEYEV